MTEDPAVKDYITLSDNAEYVGGSATLRNLDLRAGTKVLKLIGKKVPVWFNSLEAQWPIDDKVDVDVTVEDWPSQSDEPLQKQPVQKEGIPMHQVFKPEIPQLAEKGVVITVTITKGTDDSLEWFTITMKCCVKIGKYTDHHTLNLTI